MIESIQIQNFQVHDKLRIDFAPGITTIVGPSDAGKSAIIRALRWACTNTPGGDAFVRHGARGATVKVVIDGHTITRRRSPGGSINEYRLDNAEFKAFGRDVPDAIKGLVNMESVGWQGQHDAAYWFSNTAGEVSRQLNAIVNLSIIDDTMARVAKSVHRGRTKLEMSEESLTTAKKEFDDLAWVPDFDAAVTVVEAAEAAHVKAGLLADSIAILVTKASTHQRAGERAVGVDTAGQFLVESGEKAMSLQKDAALMEQLINIAREAEQRVDTTIPLTGPMEDAFDAYKTSSSRGMALLALIEEAKNKEARLCQAEAMLIKSEKAVPKKCPTCGK